ncbi:HD domain-containing protein [Candidatus Woesearchaeota archaeon]|nr:HD domain-containing protein [Candidatus Woesearchaeota archaeon]
MEFSQRGNIIYQRILRDPQVLLRLKGLRSYHPDSYRHVVRTGRFAIHLGEQMGLDDARLLGLGYGGALHDIGKLGVSHCILAKPGPLNDEEYGRMREHPRIGFNELGDFSIAQVPLMVVAHHEFQSRSYPRGRQRREMERRLRAVMMPRNYHRYHRSVDPQEVERYSFMTSVPHMTGWDYRRGVERRTRERREMNLEIITDAQIIAAADEYDALSCRRGYKEPFPADKVRRIMREDYKGPIQYIDLLLA